MKIVVASGKGGTGKSTLSANFSYVISGNRDVVLVDCDVEEPNLHLFFEEKGKESIVTLPIPVIDENKCDFCGKCGEFCQYGAITVLKDQVMVLQNLCHSCGGCLIVCPNDAISEVPKTIGVLWDARINSNLRLITGVLNEGEANGIEIIKTVKRLSESSPLVIYDSSPGTACPVIETVEGADFCILVTESTPFGLHDLKLAAEVVKKIGVPSGVVINRSDGSDNETEEFCRENDLEILLKIPFDREIAAIQNRGELFSVYYPDWQKQFTDLLDHIESLCGGNR